MNHHRSSTPSLIARLVAFGALATLPIIPTARAGQTAATSQLTGRFHILSDTDAHNDAIPAPGGTVDIDPRRSAYTVNWRFDQGRPLRGIGLSDGTDLLGASLYTGGVAHGLAIYRRADGGRRWQGQWITSIDSASIVGVMDFDADPKQPTLAGRHHFSGHRATTGQFDGVVTITPQGEDYTLAFTTSGGATLYRGIGILRGDRLVVAWSFGSSPAVAVYELGARGELNGRRLSLRSRSVVLPTRERLIPASAATAAGGANEAEPGAPVVKTSVYLDLVTRYNASGWVERWLDSQLTADEQRVLQLAVRRHHLGDPAAGTLGAQTVGQLIEEERKLQGQ